MKKPMPTIRIIIQSRLSSERLPAKALLPIAGLPSVVLCGLRALNAGHDVVLATSEAPEDEQIEKIANQHGIRTYRGSLDDVLARFANASKDLNDEDLIVRLTADNMFPDGKLVQELIARARNNNADRYRFDWGLPFGAGIDIFRVRLLRLANENATSRYDREHVGPWINRNSDCEVVSLPSKWKNDLGDCSHIRATMDSLSDYVKVSKLFDTIDDSENATVYDLTKRFIQLFNSPAQSIAWKNVSGRHVCNFQLGTAQLGSDYGVANNVGQMQVPQVQALLKEALELGVNEIETARDYGVAEDRIGSLIPRGDASRFKVTTKLSNLEQLTPEAKESEVRAAVDASIFRSCRELRLHTLPILLMHRFHHLQSWDGAVYRRLIELRNSGVISEIGVSIYDEDELDILAKYSDINHVQLPFNVLDHRWISTESTKKIKMLSEKGVSVSVRSALLQGLVLAPEDKWPVNPEIARAIKEWLRRMAKECERESVQDFCFSFVRSFEWIHKVVVGVDSSQQLAENVKYFRLEPLSVVQRQRVCDSVPNFPMKLIDPRTWFQNE